MNNIEKSTLLIAYALVLDDTNDEYVETYVAKRISQLVREIFTKTMKNTENKKTEARKNSGIQFEDAEEDINVIY